MKEEENDKVVPIIKLGLWLVFIAVLVIVAKFGGTKQNIADNNNKVEVISYEDKLEKINNNYKYSYEIKINNNMYKFAGSKMGERESGYRIVNEEYLYYFLENGYIYQVDNGGLDKIDTLYDNIDVNYLDVIKIKESIKNTNYSNIDNIYNYSLEDKNIIIYTDEENIIKIEINIGENYYKLEFSDIGLIEEIKY